MTRLLLPLAVLSLARAVRALTAELAAGRWRQGRERPVEAVQPYWVQRAMYPDTWSNQIKFTTSTGNGATLHYPNPGGGAE